MEQQITVILCLLQIFSAGADYRLEVTAHTYSNPQRTTYDGRCCDLYFSPPCHIMNCDPQFSFCLRSFGRIQDGAFSENRACPLGRFDPSQVFYSDGSTNITFPESFNFVFTGSGSWRGGFQLVIPIVDIDPASPGSTPPPRHPPTPNIDIIYAQELMTAGQSITQRIYTGYYSIANITLSISLSCTSLFGPNCDDHCPPLPNPKNGVVDQPSTIVQASVATYTCNEGYDLVGDATQTCQSSGVWSGSPPICQAITLCEPLPNPANGVVQHPSVILQGTVATYTCNDGYDLVIGDTARSCQSSGVWSGSPPICHEHFCEPLTYPVNGVVDQPRVIVQGSVATYTCNDGYNLVIGDTTRTCQSSGVWSGRPPICHEIILCEPLPNPANGVIQQPSAIFQGSVAMYTCSDGYNLVGDTTRTCLSSGAWSGSPPICQPANPENLCEPLPNAANGVVQQPTLIVQGSVATYTCNDGDYVLFGYATRMCLATGVWDGGPSACIQGHCESSNFAGFQWPDTQIGTVASVSCPDPCEAATGSQIHRLCEGTLQGPQWSNTTDDFECTDLRSNVTNTLCALLNQTSDSNDTVSIEVAEALTNITSNSENIVAADISVSARVLEELTEEASIIPEVRDNFLQTIDNIQRADREEVLISQRRTQSSSRVINSIARFLDTVELDAYQTENTTIRTIGFETYALQAQNIDPSRFNGQTFIADLGSVEEALNNSGRIDTRNLITAESIIEVFSNATASIFVPKDVLLTDNSSTNDTQRLSHAVFLTDVLFQDLSRNTSGYVLGSIIVNVRLGQLHYGNHSVETPIRTTFRIIREVADIANDSSCVSWDDSGFGSWSASACKKEIVKGDSSESVTCSCKQLAHFAILFDLNPQQETGISAIVLSTISYIGLVLSLVCLTIFIITYFSSKDLRAATHGQILINMSVALMGLYIFFLIGGHVTSVPPLCGISSALLQYFILVFFAWTVVEAVWLFLNLVIVMGIHKFTARYTLAAGLPSWLVPIVIVIASVGPDYKFYVNEFYCRATGWPFWFGTILPFLLMFIVDWVLFIIVFTVACKHAYETRKRKGESDPFNTLRDSALISITLATVLGLGWGFGLIATSQPNKELTFVFQILFSVFVGTQGILIFILHGLRSSDARKLWKDCFLFILRKPNAVRVKNAAASSGVDAKRQIKKKHQQVNRLVDEDDQEEDDWSYTITITWQGET